MAELLTLTQQQVVLRKALDVLIAQGIPADDYQRVLLKNCIEDHEATRDSDQPCWDLKAWGECRFVVQARAILSSAGVSDTNQES